MEPLEEAVLHTLRLVSGHGIQRHCVDAAEDAVLDVGVAKCRNCTVKYNA